MIRPFRACRLCTNVPDFLLDQWRQAAADLGLTLEITFRLQLQSGAINARLLVKDFGAANGMLIVTDFSVIKPFMDELEARGYGFSTLPEPRSRERYNRESFVEVLCDWGWTGSDDDRPGWYVEAEGESRSID